MEVVRLLLAAEGVSVNQAYSADSYFPLDVAYQASCGSNLLFRLEIQEYDQGQTKPHH